MQDTKSTDALSKFEDLYQRCHDISGTENWDEFAAAFSAAVDQMRDMACQKLATNDEVQAIIKKVDARNPKHV